MTEARKARGASPPSAKAAGSGKETIRYSLSRCRLGWALVAVSEKGVCALLLGDAAETLREEIPRRFPNAILIETPSPDEVATQALSLVDGSAASAAFPIDARGSDFQRRVWSALRAIAPGQTTTYAEIARRLGAPGSARAVAGAIAANPIAVAIPCHRVLRSDGGLSGYRWGVERKRALLAREREAAPG